MFSLILHACKILKKYYAMLCSNLEIKIFHLCEYCESMCWRLKSAKKKNFGKKLKPLLLARTGDEWERLKPFGSLKEIEQTFTPPLTLSQRSHSLTRSFLMTSLLKMLSVSPSLPLHTPHERESKGKEGRRGFYLSSLLSSFLVIKAEP